ncbi:MAG: PDZ domain-containing protein, partial [Verrucomicrobium sp.]
NFIRDIRALGQYATDAAAAQKLTGVCDRLAIRIETLESDQAASRERMSVEGYEKARQSLATQRQRLDLLRSRHASLSDKYEEVSNAAEQWTLAFEQLRKISGEPFAQEEMSKDVKKFLLSFKAPRARKAVPFVESTLPSKVQPAKVEQPLPGELPDRGRWDASSHLVVKQTLGIMVMLNSKGRSDKERAGVQIEAVFPGLPGAQAGLQSGDVITKVNDVVIGGKGDLANVCRGLAPGQQVQLQYIRRSESESAEKTTTLRSHLAR